MVNRGSKRLECKGIKQAERNKSGRCNMLEEGYTGKMWEMSDRKTCGAKSQNSWKVQTARKYHSVQMLL